MIPFRCQLKGGPIVCQLTGSSPAGPTIFTYKTYSYGYGERPTGDDFGPIFIDPESEGLARVGRSGLERGGLSPPLCPQRAVTLNRLPCRRRSSYVPSCVGNFYDASCLDRISPLLVVYNHIVNVFGSVCAY